MSWQAASFAILALVLAGAFLWYERQRPPARVLALVAALAALAVVGRLAFAAIPNVKPTTDIVLFAGYALGGVPGFVVGAVTALVSNVFLSQGPWTAWQMVGWGAVGAGGALLAWLTRGRELGRVQLALVCGLAGAAFGAWMDVYQWTLAARQDLPTYLAISGTSLPYNVAHVVGNVGFCLLIGPAFVRALRRYRRRFEIHWQPRQAASVAAVALLALALATGASIGSEPAAAATATTTATTPAGDATTIQAAAKTPAAKAVAYLRSAQNADGGFGPARKQSSTTLHSGWVALGLAAAGHNARDVKRKRGRTAASYLTRTAKGLSEIGEIERTALVAAAMGSSLRSYGGHDLVQEILRQKRSDGSIAGQVSYTSFGILALRAARQSAGSPAIAWLLGSQNADGGFGVARGTTSDADMTGVVLESLATVGRSSSPVAKRAVQYLQGTQNSDGGFAQRAGDSSNAQSTAYAVQGLVAAGGADAAVARANSYLVSLQRSDGSIGYSSTSRQTPVWVTAQALMALRRAPLPVGAAPRKPKPLKAAAAEPKADAGAGAAAPTGGGSSGAAAAGGAAAPAVTTPNPADLLGVGGAAGASKVGRSAPAPTTTPLTVPTPEPDPADAASAQRAAAGAGDQGVPPGTAIGIGLAVLAVLGLIWLLRRRLLTLARRSGTLLPARLRRSS